MPTTCALDGPQAADLLTRLIRGEPWTARRIRSLNFRQHCRRLAGSLRPPYPPHLPSKELLQRLFTVVATRTALLDDCHPDTWDATAVLLRLAHYHPGWLRQPETWQPDPSAPPTRQWQGLVRHLLAAWPLPAWFESAWLAFGSLGHLERDWYCHAARGQSLHTARGMPPTVSARALHLAMEVSHATSLRQAVRLGQLHACGATPALAAEVLASRIMMDFSDDAFWSRLMQKTAAARDPAPGTFSLIADTLTDIIRRGEPARALTLLRLPLTELGRYSERWWQGIAASLVESGWNPSATNIHLASCRSELGGLAHAVWARLPGIDPAFSIRLPGADGLKWTFHELTSQVQLLLEGRQLRHCVSSYRRRCETGTSVIFSLRCQDPRHADQDPVRQLTLEIHPAKRRIVQVRGKWNRSPSVREMDLISAWASWNNLTLAA